MTKFIFPLTLAAVIALASGCASPPRQSEAAGAKAMTVPYKMGDIVDLQRSATLSFDQLVDQIQAARVVYLGETHVSREDHRLQQRVIQELCNRQVPVTVAMEMFSRSTSAVLDRWSQGELEEGDFVEQSQWQRQWGYPWQLYRGIFETIRDCRLKLIGLNLPHEVVSKVARKGLASLTPAERNLIASDQNLQDAEHRNQMEREFSTHPGAGIKDFESFYQAQLAWEETMAERLAQELQTDGLDRLIVVIIGKGHVNRRFGVPERTRRRLPHPYLVVTTVPLEAADPAMLGPALADYALITDTPRFSHRRRARLGVMLEPNEPGYGFRVLRVVPESAAAAADIRAGDELLRIDGRPVETITDVRQAIRGQAGFHTVMVRRSNQVLTLVVQIRDEGEGSSGQTRRRGGD